MQHSESIKEISAAMNKFRLQVKQPAKSADNPFFKSKYVTLEGVVNTIDEALKDTGLAYFQEATSEGSSVQVSTMIIHTSGEWMSFESLNVPVAKNDAQAFGSAETYARRYSLSAIFGVTSDLDDDGNAAAKSAPKEKPQRRHTSNTRAQNNQQTNRQQPVSAPKRSQAELKTMGLYKELKLMMGEKIATSAYRDARGLAGLTDNEKASDSQFAQIDEALNSIITEAREKQAAKGQRESNDEALPI